MVIENLIYVSAHVVILVNQSQQTYIMTCHYFIMKMHNGDAHDTSWTNIKSLVSSSTLAELRDTVTLLCDTVAVLCDTVVVLCDIVAVFRHIVLLPYRT